MSNTLISGNTSPSGAEVANSGTIVVNRNNLFGHNGLTNATAFVGVTPGATDINANASQTNATALTSIINTTLSDTGGGTVTHSLVVGSPAFNRGSNARALGPTGAALTTDQRGIGFPRIVDSTVDIGAYELVPPPTTLTVNTLVDEADGSVTDGDISLRDALAAIANGGTIKFASNFVNSVFTLNGTELLINKSVTIDGDTDNNDSSPNVTINANNLSRIFSIDDGNATNKLSVTLDGLTLTGGSSTQNGGAIRNNEENVTILNSTLANNSAAIGGAIANNLGTVTFTNSTLSGNSATTLGGAIYNQRGSVTVRNSTISGNSATAQGGGVLNNGGTVTLGNSTITLNTAPLGSGVHNRGQASGTINGQVLVTSSIIAGNTNTDVDNGGETANTRFTSSGSNLIGDGNAISFFNQSTDITNNADPKLVPLGNNGGPTQTHAHLAGSPAIDKGSNPNNLTTDQRGAGFDRVKNGKADIGAYESNSTSLVVNTLGDEADGSITDGDISLRDALAFIGPGGTITFASGLNNGTITLTNGPLNIQTDVTINGDIDNNPSTANVTISGNNATRIFTINDGNESTERVVSLNGLTLIGGNTNQTGGAIFNEENLTLTNSTLRDNRANLGGGLYTKGTTTITGSTISGNSATNRGGGIYSGGTTITMTNSTISGNSATFGGGLFNYGSTIAVRNSTVTLNQGSQAGGGVYTQGYVYNGVTNNGRVTVTSSIIAGNVTGDVATANNTAGTGFVSSGNNLIGTGNGNTVFTQTGDLNNNTNPGVEPLANNGGPTQTHGLLPSSPALNAGSNSNNLTTDQRGSGFNRVIGGRADIGAFEASITIPPNNLVVDILIDENDGNLTPGDISLREALGAIADGGTITFAPSLANGTIVLNGTELLINKNVTINGDTDNQPSNPQPHH
ncbi:MAG: hypothetical protein HC796_12070 [Synechococcaceae cyanobacterium RL_1_2]|nr:hypothetical protein [Synechococcaceae cyanobacterium RL_1_2]